MKILSNTIDRSQKTVAVAYASVILLVLMGGIFISPKFLSRDFLLLQLVQASILGCIAAGQMIVILTGNMDLSVSWTLNLSAIFATSVYAGQSNSIFSALLVGLLVGALVGVVNGIGVAFLRVPAIIFTLGINSLVKGIQVLYLGAGSHYDKAPKILEIITNKRLGGFFPLIALVWAAVAVIMVFLTKKSRLGLSIRALGHNPVAAFLSGVRVKWVLFICYVLSGIFSSLGGLLLLGYSGKSFSEMGEPYQMPAIAAVVVGGVLIEGGSGSYIGVMAGVLMITLLNSALSIIQMPSAGRLIIFGLLILVMVMINSEPAESNEY